jgi:nitroreductase/NAD-dependent dihydropyrimidine dehydrogenase PreA subunit
MSEKRIEIDEEKCTECGLCVDECVSGVFEADGKKPVVSHPSWCNRCSHCMAICPADAVINRNLEKCVLETIDKELLDPQSYSEIVRTRRSVRSYKDKQVPKELIQEILDLAACSPTASNAQDVGYTIVTDREIILAASEKTMKVAEKMGDFFKKPWVKPLKNKLTKNGKPGVGRYLERWDTFEKWKNEGRDLVIHHAPVLVLIHGPKKGRFVRENCAIAATNLTNYAHARGLGSCYIGLLVVAMDWNKKLTKSLGVPENKKTYLAVTLGWPSRKFKKSVKRPLAKVNWI